MANSGASPSFLTPRRGLGDLVAKLVDRLVERGASFVPHRVLGLERSGTGWVLKPTEDRYDAVVLATGPADTVAMLGREAPPGLRRIPSASVALAIVWARDCYVPTQVNGVLIPASEGWLMTACSFASSKWPHWAGPGESIFRLSAGRAGDDRADRMSDDTLVERLCEELARITKSTISPTATRVRRWPHSFPQFQVGHLALVRSIFDGLDRDFPMVRVCGASYFGAGIPTCIASGRRAAEEIMERAS